MEESRSGPKNRRDPVVYALSRPSRCYNCDKKLLADEIVRLKTAEDEREVLCQGCSGLEEFVIVRGGNPKITRLATKYSSIRYLILKWSDLWKCYERQGILVEKQAVDRLESELGIKKKKL